MHQRQLTGSGDIASIAAVQQWRCHAQTEGQGDAGMGNQQPRLRCELQGERDGHVRRSSVSAMCLNTQWRTPQRPLLGTPCPHARPCGAGTVVPGLRQPGTQGWCARKACLPAQPPQLGACRGVLGGDILHGQPCPAPRCSSSEPAAVPCLAGLGPTCVHAAAIAASSSTTNKSAPCGAGRGQGGEGASDALGQARVAGAMRREPNRPSCLQQPRRARGGRSAVSSRAQRARAGPRLCTCPGQAAATPSRARRAVQGLAFVCCHASQAPYSRSTAAEAKARVTECCCSSASPCSAYAASRALVKRGPPRPPAARRTATCGFIDCIACRAGHTRRTQGVTGWERCGPAAGVSLGDARVHTGGTCADTVPPPRGPDMQL